MASYYNTHQIHVNEYVQPPQYVIQHPAYIAPPPPQIIVEAVEPAQKEVIVQTTTTTDTITQTPSLKTSNFSSKWLSRKKLELCEFDPYYSLNLVDRISSIEYMNIIDECSVRFREVIKPWRTFWKKHKNFVPAEFVAAIATFCLSMFVTIPLWYSMYKKAKKKTEEREMKFRNWLQRMNRDVWLPRGYQVRLRRSKRIVNGKDNLENVRICFEFIDI